MTKQSAVLQVVAQGVILVASALSLLGLLDLLGLAVTFHAGVFPGGGLLDGWGLTPSAFSWSVSGLGTLAVLTGIAALSVYGAARLGMERAGGLGALLGLMGALTVWAPLALVIVGAQALVLALDRAPERAAALAQAARILGLAAATLMTATSPPALAVTLLAVGLAPSALVALSRPRAPARARAADPDPEPAREPQPLPQALDPTPAVAPTRLEGRGAPADTPAEADTDVDTGASPFGADPVAALVHLCPAERLLQSARSMLADGRPAVLAVVRMDGLAGIAEHLGAEGGERLFAVATERLAAALPDDASLSWFGDETFVALLPASRAEDLADPGVRLAAPFAEVLMVDGRPISMEDAIHADAVALDEETLTSVTAWLRPG